jgi:hypothetical protein
MAIKSIRAAACIVAAGTLAALALGAIPAQAQPPARASSAGWRVTQVYGTGSANIYAGTSPPMAGALAAAGGNSAWSVWVRCGWPCTGAPTYTLRHWNGHNWGAVPGSDLQGLTPYQVTASSVTDAWVLGSVAGSRYLGLRHWNGSKWRKVAAPSWLAHANGALEYSIYMADFGPDNLWVFSLGGYAGEKTEFAAHYQNGRWSKSYLPDIAEQAAALSSKDIWVLGQAFSGKGPIVMLRWTGHRWVRSAFPRQREAGYPYGLVATGSGSLWLVWQPSKAGAAQYLLHCTGHRWARVDLPASDIVLTMTGDGHGGLWDSAVGPGTSQPQLFMHWSAGRWAVTRVPSSPGLELGQVDELAVIPGTRSVWAVGHLYGPGDGTTLNRGAIWRYNP